MTMQKESDQPKTTGNLCKNDGKPCHVGGGTDDAHWRCGTVQCGLAQSPTTGRKNPAEPARHHALERLRLVATDRGPLYAHTPIAGGEAAHILAEIERLRRALAYIVDTNPDQCPGDSMEDAYAHIRQIAREAI